MRLVNHYQERRPKEDLFAFPLADAVLDPIFLGVALIPLEPGARGEKFHRAAWLMYTSDIYICQGKWVGRLAKAGNGCPSGSDHPNHPQPDTGETKHELDEERGQRSRRPFRGRPSLHAVCRGPCAIRAGRCRPAARSMRPAARRRTAGSPRPPRRRRCSRPTHPRSRAPAPLVSISASSPTPHSRLIPANSHGPQSPHPASRP